MGAAGPDTGLTTEHLKSHLQKYRLNYERSRTEFLEFYDHSAKKNLKRRRKHGNKPGEHNTMFVFPITHKKQKGESDSDDSDDEGTGHSAAGPDDGMSDSTLEHMTPRGSTSSSVGGAALERTGSFTNMMQDPKDAMSAAAAVYAQRNQQLQMMTGNNSDRSSFGNTLASTQAMQAAAYAASQQHQQQQQQLRKSSLSGSTSSNSSSTNNTNANAAAAAAAINSRAMAAAAAAAAAFRYPLGLPMGANASGAGVPPNSQFGDLSDPQWNILSSLMSPHIAGMNAPGSNAMVPPTSESMGSGADSFQLQDESARDLQLQMHLAMQAQMNLHRQMLTRKVEVSQHINNSQSQQQAALDNNNSNNSFNVAWSNAQRQQLQQQQQQYYQHQQHEQQRQARQALVNAAHHPQMQMALAMNNNSSSSQPTPRPSLAPRTSSSSNVLAASMGMGSAPNVSQSMNSASYANVRAPIPLAVGPPVEMGNVLMPESSSVADSSAFDKSATAPGAATAEDDSLDLYRWDRIDLNVELDDDDLFGFLKS